MAHTPGPWKVNEIFDIEDANGKLLAETAEYHDPNAHLIAAAPEMLAALKEIAKGEGEFSTDRLTHANNTIENMMAIAEQAIAKTEGDTK